MSDSNLLLNGQMACTEVSKGGLTPDLARGWADIQLQSVGGPQSYAAATALVHYALRDLCPDVPNTTGL